ncbi:hypothetical protein C359_06501 [Cryptococcus neoformans Bt120]|nr:hypothetical protein C359_06501 [Cryptococcus neoformans var. grubii Bt120]
MRASIVYFSILASLVASANALEIAPARRGVAILSRNNDVDRVDKVDVDRRSGVDKVDVDRRSGMSTSALTRLMSTSALTRLMSTSALTRLMSTSAPPSVLISLNLPPVSSVRQA